MSGTNVDLSGYKPGQPYKGTTSSTTNEVDVLSGFPSWCKRVSIYADAASRMGHPASGAKANTDTLTDSEAHKPIPATTWLEEDYCGGNIYVSSASTSSGYTFVLYEGRK